MGKGFRGGIPGVDQRLGIVFTSPCKGGTGRGRGRVTFTADLTKCSSVHSAPRVKMLIIKLGDVQNNCPLFYTYRRS